MHCLESHSKSAVPSDLPSKKEGERGLTDPVGNKRGPYLMCFPPPGRAPSSFYLWMLSCFNRWFEDLGCYYFLVAVGLNDQERKVDEVVTGWDGKGPFLLNELSSKKHHTINIWWAILFIHSLSLPLSLSVHPHPTHPFLSYFPPSPSLITTLNPTLLY